MARPTELQSILAPVIRDSIIRIAAAVEDYARTRAQQDILAYIQGRHPVRRGRPPASEIGAGMAVSRKSRRKAPIQFCPVPGCKNRAAPVFGMVCSEHRKVPKAQIRKYRAARRKAKETKAA